jgi:chitinase
MAARALAAGVGRAFLMGYDYRTAESTTVGSVAPLVRAGGGLALAASLDLYAAMGVPLDRVILGLPLYGRTWQTADQGFGAQRVAGASGTVFLFRDLASVQAQGTILAADTDTIESSARLVRAVDGAIYQTYYDSPSTIAPKLALIADRGLAGAGFWALGYDRDPTWWRLVATTFRAASTTADAVSESVVDRPGNAAQPR